MPFSASTHSPESSATDGRPVAAAADARLHQRVLGEGQPVLDDVGSVGPAAGTSSTSDAGRAQDVGAAPRACARCAWPAPAGRSCVRERLLLQPVSVGAAGRRRGRAARRAAPGRTAPPSAVPCTSTNAPSPVITTFMSVSARDVLLVAEVEHRLAVDDADRHRGDRAGQRLARPAAPRSRSHDDGVGQRDVGAGDGRGAGAAVGLQHVAVEHDGVLAQRLVVDRPRAATRPTSREISWVRPPIRPLTDSRSDRVLVERGSIAYSAVTQPRPLPLRQRGTPSVTEAAHSTRVLPNSTSTEPSAWSSQPRVMRHRRAAGRGCVRRCES